MWYTRKTDSGYTPPQSTNAPGLVAFPDEMLETFLAYAGFVEFEISEGAAVSITPDVEAFEAWEAEEAEREENASVAEENNSDVWDALDKAYNEGRDSAYDS